MLYSCTHMATVDVKGLTERLRDISEAGDGMQPECVLGVVD